MMGDREEGGFSERLLNQCGFLVHGKIGQEQKDRDDILKRKGK